MTNPTIEDPAPLAHRQVLVAFSGLLLVMLLAALDSTIVSTALPTIVGELGGLEHLAWVVTGYLLAQTVVTPIYGKLGDLYGRKIVMQAAIVLFLAGSALCGLSQDMTQLIAFRFVQGLGGGGLTVTTQAIVGDIVPPRERGRYQGIFGALYGLASIAGPLLGGFFTTHLTWRWIFYINLPLGIMALVVLAATLPQQTLRKAHAIDYAGAALLAISLSSLTLIADLGGSAYAWSSPMMLGMIAATAIALAGFAIVERRAAEPVLPLRLFGQQTFLVSTLVGLIVGFALFGSVTYLPVYLQVVKGVSPTQSGLQMLPMMLGMLTTSVISGQLISRTGRYKVFPILGTAVMTAGLFFLSRLSAESSALTASVLMLMLGLGIGMVMQVLIIAVQNAADYRDLGVATSGATLFRLIGGSLGTAILGAVFASRLAANLAHALPDGLPIANQSGMSAATLARLPEAARAAYAGAFTASLDTVFLVATVVCATGFVLALLLPERPLRGTIAVAAEEPGAEAAGAFGRPADESSTASQLLHAFRTLADRDVQRGHIERIVERAGESLPPLAAWLLVQFEREPTLDAYARTKPLGITPDGTAVALTALESRGLVRASGGHGHYSLTPAGCEVNDRLVEARRAHLRELVEEWHSRDEPDADAFLRDAVREMVPATRREVDQASDE